MSSEEVRKGFRFCAMIGANVPECVLQHHNEFHPGPRESLPRYGTHDQGIWLPERDSENAASMRRDNGDRVDRFDRGT